MRRAQRMVRIVGGAQHSVSRGGQRLDLAHHLALVAEVEIGGRLVEHDELGLLRRHVRFRERVSLGVLTRYR
jgi:hypothetical protein